MLAHRCSEEEQCLSQLVWDAQGTTGCTWNVLREAPDMNSSSRFLAASYRHPSRQGLQGCTTGKAAQDGQRRLGNLGIIGRLLFQVPNEDARHIGL